MMKLFLFAPPIVFSVFMLIFLLFSSKLNKYSNNHEKELAGEEYESESYACGQKNVKHYVNPNYSQFFPYAFFFTILHVLVLVVVTAPKAAPILPIAYIVSGALAMLVLFKKSES